MRALLLIITLGIFQTTIAQVISGTVTDSETGQPLPYASVYVKGTTKGTTTNDQGKFEFSLVSLNVLVVCQYIGYEKQEQEIKHAGKINFALSKKHTQIKTVKISASGEDPAYKIIRAAIKKRPDYNQEIEKFTVNCYIKGKLKLNETPNMNGFMKLLGAGEGDGKSGDSAMEEMKGIMYLSESYSKIGYQRKPEKYKVLVQSSKVSGSQNDYGFSDPMFINFYENNVSFGSQLSPRGFVSPIASSALRFYNYKLLETYFEDGEWINRIQVTPKRKLEPVMAGEIHIIDNSWRIHSLDLFATKNYELNVLDTVRIKQIHVPVDDGYTVKDQVFSLAFTIFGFGGSGQFVNVFTNYKSEVDDNFFDRYIMEYDSLALKKNDAHWDSIRVIPLENEEVRDYEKKDSIRIVTEARQDSMRAAPFSYKPQHILFRGLGYRFNKNASIKTEALIGLNRIKYNTAEGVVYELPVRFYKKINADKNINASLSGRYGFGSNLLSGKGILRYQWGKSNQKTIHLSGGQYVFQYNNQDPVSELLNSISTLYSGQNYLKTYQAIFAKASYANHMFNGVDYKVSVDYQKRNALYNTDNYTLFKRENYFTANYPTEIINQTIPNHARLEMSLMVMYQPGRELIKYPDRVVSTSSRYPTFYGGVFVAQPIFNTTSDYSRWRAGIKGDLNLKLYGQFKYRWNIGGFIHNNLSYAPDYTHFNGNQLLLASEYLNSFQLASYYANSNTESFYTSYHVEQHFQGLGTNKVPLFRKMKYYLVLASNGYYVNQDNNYLEFSAGLENLGVKLFRFIRVDAVVGYQNFENPVFGIRVGFSGSIISLSSRQDVDE